MPLNYDLDKAQQDIAELQAQNSVPQEEDKGILDTIWDNVTSGAELVVDTLDDGLQALRAYNAAAGGRGDISLEQAEDNLKMSLINRPMNAFVNKFADKDTPLLSSMADTVQSSELAYTQIIPDEKKWEQARKIQQEIGIPAETVMYDQTAWKNANNLYDEYQKAKEFYGPDMSQEDIKQINPIIQKVSTADPAAGALIMADAYNTNKELSIIDTFNEYMEMGQMKLELDELGEKYREQKHSFEDLYRIQELQDKINHFNNKHNINFVDNPLAYAVAGLGGSWPEMSQSLRAAAEDEAAWMVAGMSAGGMAGSVVPVAGTATGATVGAAGGAAVGLVRNLPRLTRAGRAILGLSKNTVARDIIGKALVKAKPGMFTGAQIGAFRGMAEPEVGGRYLEYREMKDENGNPLMDHEEASERAVIAGSANAALEIFPTFSVFGKMTKGSKAQSAVIDELFRAAGNRYFQKSVATTAAAEFTKNSLKGAFTESGEEMLQNISDDLMLNDIEATHNDKANGGVKSYYDIALDGVGAFVASFPTSLLFGAGGAIGAGTFSSGKYAAQRRNISRQEKMFGAELENTAIGNALAIDLQEAVHDSKLKQSAPDVQKQIIHEKAAGTGFENVYIDVEMALEKENGKEDLRAVAKAANISDEELDIAIEEKGTLSVPLECFAQSESSQELLESASYNAETKSIARMKKEAKNTMDSIKKAYDENLAQQERIINTIITELFPAEENDKVSVARQDMAKSIIMTFSENPAMGWREMMKLVQDERMEIIGGALKYLQETSGNGVSIIPTEDGKGVRASNNAQWYSDWYSEHGRKPTKAELEDIAEDMMRGKRSIGDNHNIPEEELQATNAALDEINGKIKALEEIKDKMLGLTGVEMKLTEGLSKEAYAGYRQIMDQLQHAPAKAVRAARMNAILLARHADLYAKIMQKKGNNDYTAKDYMDSVALRFGGQNLGGTQQGMFNQEDFTKNNQGVIKNPYLATEIEKYNNIEPITVIPNKIRKTETKGAITVAIEEFKKLYPDGKKVDTVIGEVWIGQNSIQNSFSGRHTKYQSKFDAVLTLADGMEKAAYIGYKGDLNGKNAVNHYFAYPIIYDGKNKIVVCRVKEESKQFTLYLHEVFDVDIINKTSRTISDSAFANAISQGLRGPALIKYILADFHRKIKEYTYGINNNSPQINGSMYQMAGERAKTAALEKLEKAKAMEQAGKLSDDIYKETGWLKGKDDKWRFEITDNLGGIHAKEFIEAGPATRWPLGRLYENDALYEAYPSLWNVPVLLSTEMKKDTNGATAFSLIGESIKINYKNGTVEPEQLKRTLLHEIQHIIQKKEGFAKGGSAESVMNQINDTITDLESQLLEGITDEWSDDNAVIQKAKELVKTHNDIELQNIISEPKEVEENRKKLAEIKAQIEELLPGKTANDVFGIVSKIRKLEVLREKYDAASPEEKEKLAYNYYYRLAGEQEANMTAGRAHFLDNSFNEAMNARNETEQLSLNLEKELKQAPEDIKELAGEYIRFMREREEVADNQEALEEKINEMEGIEKKLNETEQGTKILDAIQEYDWAHLEESEYWNRYQEERNRKPEPHGNNAIVVFGGRRYYSVNNAAQAQDTFYQSVWHGSPFDFDEFDLGAIGSGEGAQGHGWGLYFAANMEVSEAYKKKLSHGITIKGDSYIAITTLIPEYNSVFKNGSEDITDRGFYTLIKTLEDEGSYEKALAKLNKDSNSRLKGKAHWAQSALELLKKYSPDDISFGGKLYEVEIPDTDVMLDEDLSLDEQPQKVREAIVEYWKSRPDFYITPEGINDLGKGNGRNFYKDVVFQMRREGERAPERAASELLNSLGIKGITYEGAQDGRCYVVFDDKAISIIEKFNQGIKGSLTPMADGQRIITLFESADESTFLHEMGHLFLLDLEELAKIDEQSAKELATVTEWAKFRKSDVKGYKGSPFEGEFLKLAADIEAAEKAGDVATADKLKRRWMHERFARGFEMYLEFGEAPSKGLKAVFRKFKQFLKVLYFGFAGQGVRATPEVEKIMARMIASDNEIEAMALDSRYKDITKAGGEKLLGETEAQTMQRWHEEGKEEAKEKLMAIIMKDLSEEKKRERQAKIDKEREEVTTFMTSMPVYIAQKVIAETGSKDAVVEMGIYSSIEQLESDLEAVKDIPLDKAIEDHMVDYEADLDKKQMDEEMTEEKLSKIMNQTYYHNKLLALETAALQERTRTMQRINSKAKNAIHEANVAIDGLDDDVEIKLDKNSPKVKAVLRALAKLRYADRWSTEDLQAIDKIINSSTKSEIAEALKEFETNSGQWKKNLKILQEAFDGQHRIIENAAKNDLAKKKLIDACAYRHYVSMEKNASNLMNMFIRQGKWEAALRQQQFRLQAAAMAKYAKKNQEKLKKLTDKVTKQLSARTVKVAKDERYWHRHLAYLLGLNKEAPVKPEELISAIDLFKIFNDTLDVNEKDDEFNKKLINIYEKVSRQDFGGYMTLTMAELEDAVDMLTVLYTTGRDKFRMKSFDGKMLHEVVDEICWDETGINIMTQNRYINPDTGGLGYNDILAKVPFIGENLSRVGQKYINAHIKPEELLKLIGDKAHKYIYGLYERAANEEGKMTADSVQKLKDILSVYSHAEKREWKKQKYIFESGAGTEKISKENIICMALNRGNETNWHRLFRGLRVDPNYLANFIDENMTEKDWDTVQALWDHIGSYWSQTVKVEEKLNGVTLRGVEPKEFIVNLPDGRKKNIRGGYYPIAQNKEKSLRAEEHSVDEAARRTMKGPQVFGAGRKFVNKRSDNLNIEIPLKLSFDVIPNHLGDVIHNITYRIAARDVYRLVSAKKFENLIKDTLGAEAYRSITDWAVDCWKIMPNNTSQAEGALNKFFGYLRRNATFNIMGYRMWPVIENYTNIFPMMDRLGVVNALSAIGDYYAHKKECDLMMLKSSFMTNRINSMDRDIKTMPGLFDEDMKGLGWMKQHAYSMLVYTDLMMSAPLWCRAYKDSIAGHYVDVERENKEMVDALRAAQAKVDDLNAQMFDLKKEKQHILEQLHPGYEVEYSPQRMRAVGYLNSELARIKSQLEPMEKELWEAEKELDKLANVDLMLPDDILKEAEVRAVQTADGAVRNVFGSGHTKDLAPIQKGGEFAKMFTCFYSFFNTQANAILANYYKGKFAKEELTGLQNIAVWMPFAKSVLFRIFLTSALSTIMKMAFGLDGDDDKDKYRKVLNEDGTETKEEIPSLERFLTQYAKNTVSTASGTMVGVRDVASLVCTYLFDGYDMGGSKAGSVPTAFIDKAYSTFKLANKKEERDAKIAADEERRKARYEKMSPKQKKKFDEELQYRHPAKRITYADIAKSGVGTVTSVTAAQTGITDTMANTVMTTMQYMADGDGRYDPSLSNIMWSAFWNKKPVEREIPEKPEKPKKKNKKGA